MNGYKSIRRSTIGFRPTYPCYMVIITVAVDALPTNNGSRVPTFRVTTRWETGRIAYNKDSGLPTPGSVSLIQRVNFLTT